MRRIQTLAVSLGEEDSKGFAKFDKILAEIFEQAGKVRDLDVQMEALKTISRCLRWKTTRAFCEIICSDNARKRQRKLATRWRRNSRSGLPKRQRRAKALLLKAQVSQLDGATTRSIDLRKEVAPFVEKLRADSV